MNFQFHPFTRLVLGDEYVSFSELERRSPEAAEHGDADFYVIRSDIIVRFALTDYTEVFLDLPYKVLTLRVDNDDEHHRDETFDGHGDVRLGVKHFFFHYKSIQIAGVLGLSLPTGRLSKATAASYLDHDEAAVIGVTVPKHSHLQLGTGTFDPFVGVEALYRFGEYWIFFSSVNADIPMSENRYDYRTSPSGTLNLGPALRVPETRLIASLFAEMFYSGRDRFEADDLAGPRGTFDGNFRVPNTGRFEMALKPGVIWGITEKVSLNLQVRIPVYTRIREDSEEGDVQLTETSGFFAAVSISL